MSTDGSASPSLARRRADARLALRPRWRETAGIAGTALLALTLPFAVVATTQLNHRLDEAAGFAEQLARTAPQAADVAQRTADAARSLAAATAGARPQLQQATHTVDDVATTAQDVARQVEQTRRALAPVAALAGAIGGRDTSSTIAQLDAKLQSADATIEQIATAARSVSAGVEEMTTPARLADIERGAAVVEEAAALSTTLGHTAQAYVDHAQTVRRVAWLLAVASLVLTVAWLAVRLVRHRRWLELRRSGAEAALLAVLPRPAASPVRPALAPPVAAWARRS